MLICLQQNIHTNGQYLNWEFIKALKIIVFLELFK